MVRSVPPCVLSLPIGFAPAPLAAQPLDVPIHEQAGDGQAASRSAGTVMG